MKIFEIILLLNFRRILREVKQSGEIHLVVDCSLERIGQLLKVTDSQPQFSHNYSMAHCLEQESPLN
jgi:hypothetical protein